MTWGARARWLSVRALGVCALLLGCGVGAGACVFAAPRYHGPVSDHFDGQRFFSPGAPPPNGSLGSLLKFAANRQPGPWRDYHAEPPGPRPPSQVEPGELRVTFVNHATVLLQLDGVNVLTDPIYAERASPVSFAGPKRVRPPGIAFTDLPRIDAVVISHNHYDHLNVETLQRLQATFPKVTFFAGLGNQAYLRSVGLQHVVELDWWQSAPLGPGVQVTSVPTQHFSNRGLTDQEGTLWTGFVLEGPSGRTYFSGDTAYGPHFKMVGQRLGPFRLAVLPIGAYLPEWFMSPIHMSPLDAIKARADLGAQVAVAMHFGTFPLGDDGETQAVDELGKALGDTSSSFWVLGFGEGRQVPR